MSKLQRILEDYEVELLQSKNPLISSLLTELIPLIKETVKKYETSARIAGMNFTDFDRQIVSLTLQYDMVKNLEKYTLNTDKLSEFTVSRQNNSFVISATIERDGTPYSFQTEIINAGGYNIQRFHYRYITKTRLPITGQDTEAKRIKAELNKLSKGEKIQHEINQLTKRIEKNQQLVIANSKLTDDEILNIIKVRTYDMPYKTYTWEELSDTAKKNYDNSPERFAAKQEVHKQDSINFWKKRNITWKEQDSQVAQKEIEKLQKKLDSLLQINNN